MKRLIAIILATACVFSLTACDLDPSSTPEATNGSVSNDGNITPGQSIVPGGDDTLNSDGTLKIPDPTGSISFAVDASTWQSILSEDAVRTAMKDNSITTLTSASGSEQYQMFYCADGRYGSIQKGNIYSESICGVQDGTVYVFNRSSAEGSWTRTTYAGSYDEYVSNHYVSGAMQFLSGAASAFDRAQYVETEKKYIFHTDQIVFNAIQSKLLRLLEEMRAEKFGRDAQISICINDLVLTLNRVVYEQTTPKYKNPEYLLYQQLEEYIQDHLQEHLSLDELAKKFFVSKYHIAHVFKDNIGLSVHQFITKKRLKLCQEAISGNMSITEAYHKFGFGDYSSFYRAFKKEYGISPKDYRDMQIDPKSENF